MKRLFILGIALLSSQFTNAMDLPQDTTKTEMVYDMPEQMPQFPGGAEAMERFISEHIKYPPTAKEKRIQGKVYVQFIVEKDGSLTDIKIRRGAHQLLDDEAIRVIKLMPKWKPGSMRGKIVRVRYTIPITFALS
ncbi:MAG: energy transducer TonB [Crocinitomicaceae bacterium]|nr:energy transducer TonB [Crocinitomicaceae bacterium]